MTSAHNIACFVLIGFFALPTVVLAKRIPAPVVEPIVHNGVRYTVPNDKGTRGYVVACDAATGKQLWEKTIFRKCLCPCLEHDVQWVFIKQMRLENGRLIIVSETHNVYSLDLKTRKVKKLMSETSSAAQGRTPVSKVVSKYRMSTFVRLEAAVVFGVWLARFESCRL